MKKQQGFSLIEMAIVMVLVGLMLGGILKGQELIAAARVRSFAVQLEGVKIAYLGFHDRFRALPGDLPTLAANALIPDSPGGCTGGANCNNGLVDADENFVVWAHLSHSGFIYNIYNGTITDTVAGPANNPSNPFGGYLHLVTDNKYDDTADPAQPAVMSIKTGGFVPASVLGEIDRKIDDGAPLTGTFRSAGHFVGTAYDGVVDCLLPGTPVQWHGASTLRNCGGVSIQ